MRNSRIREYILQVFEDARSHTAKEIKEKVSEYFEDTMYTNKQVSDLLCHLAREKKIDRISKGVYCLSEERCVNMGSNEKKASLSGEMNLEENLIELERIVKKLKNNLDAPGLIQRIKKLSCKIEDVERIYDLNEQILDIMKKMKIGIEKDI